MHFNLVSQRFKDKSMQGLIVKMFEYFVSTNALRIQKIKKTKNREDLNSILSELIEYVERGLKKKFSMNFIVLASENPNYAIKYEKHYFLAFKFGNFDIIILKTPFICIPARFYKSLKTDQVEEVNKYYEEK
jgi:hypothetical protein